MPLGSGRVAMFDGVVLVDIIGGFPDSHLVFRCQFGRDIWSHCFLWVLNLFDYCVLGVNNAKFLDDLLGLLSELGWEYKKMFSILFGFVCSFNAYNNSLFSICNVRCICFG